MLNDDQAHFPQHCQHLSRHRVKKILLIQILQVDIDNFNYDTARNKGYYIFPPTGLQYLYEAIKTRDLEIQIFDANYAVLQQVQENDTFDVNAWDELVMAKVRAFQPDLIGVSCLFDFSLKYFLHLLSRLKAETDALVVTGGVIVTYEWKNLLAQGLTDFCIRGEGENKLNYLLDQVCGVSQQTPAVNGIYYRTEGQCHESLGPADIVNFDTNLIASYKLVPIHRYARYGSLNPFSRQSSGASFAAIQFSRGCRAQCTFCSVRSLMGKGVRTRSAEKVIEEMAYLIREHDVRHFEWLDDDLLFDSAEFKHILNAIIEQKWAIKWSANNGIIAASINDDVVQLMEASGCIGFKIGIESGNKEMLKKILKPSRHRHFFRAEQALRNSQHIFVGGNYIVGLPEESFFMIMDSFRLALDIELDWAGFTVCQEIRGASAFSEMGALFELQMKSAGEQGIGNFIPTRQSTKGQLSGGENHAVKRGLEVFKLAPLLLPEKAQVHEIWFTFNLVVNFINNKNLRPGGHTEKFTRWVMTALNAYPNNPYMHLFLAYAYVIEGDQHKGEHHYALSHEKMNTYWSERYALLFLQQLSEDFVHNRAQAYARLQSLKETVQPYYAHWLALDYGAYPAVAE